MRVHEAWIKRYEVLCSETDSTSDNLSLSLTSSWQVVKSSRILWDSSIKIPSATRLHVISRPLCNMSSDHRKPIWKLRWISCNWSWSRTTLHWRHNDHDGLSNPKPASRLFTQPFIQTQIKENTKAPRHWPLCGEFTGTGEFPAQMASYAENVSIWWRHHDNSRVDGIVTWMIWKGPVMQSSAHLLWLNSLRPRQNGRHFADDPFKRTFLNETLTISIEISLNFFSEWSN